MSSTWPSSTIGMPYFVSSVLIARAGEPLVVRVRAADVAEPASRLRVLDLAGRRVHVARAADSTAAVEGVPAVADGEVRGAANLTGAGAELGLRFASHPRDRLHRDDVRHDVHQSADGVGAVQQRRRASHDLDAFRRERIDRHAVIARLAREIVGALTVLEHEHTIAVEAADDGARWAGSECALRHAWLVLQELAERAFELQRQLLAGQDGGGLIRLERIARVGADRDRFGVVQFGLERDDQWLAVSASDRFDPRGTECFGRDPQVVRARTRDLRAKHALGIGRRFGLRLLDHEPGADDDGSRMCVGDLAGQGKARVLRHGRGGTGDHENECRERDFQAQAESAEERTHERHGAQSITRPAQSPMDKPQTVEIVP